MFVLRVDRELLRNQSSRSLRRAWLLLFDTLTPRDPGPFTGPFTREEAIEVLTQIHSPEIAQRVFDSLVQSGLMVEQRRSREDILAEEIFGRFQ